MATLGPSGHLEPRPQQPAADIADVGYAERLYAVGNTKGVVEYVEGLDLEHVDLDRAVGLLVWQGVVTCPANFGPVEA
jgi:hypothetical protein